MSLNAATSDTRSPLQAISDAVARHFKEQFGRGPLRCRAFYAGRDGVLVVLEGTMSPAERRLVELGEGERVRGGRIVLQSAVADDLRLAVEVAAARRVRHAVSGVDVGDDITTELFLLEPADEA